MRVLTFVAAASVGVLALGWVLVGAANLSYGDGRQLLESNKASLSPDCQGALAKLSR
jgi:hypothetical protein